MPAPPIDVVPGTVAAPAPVVPAAAERDTTGRAPTAPTTEPAPAEATEEASPREPRTTREARPDRRGAGASRPPEPEEDADDTPCGAATGIPCLD
jgi:hypothetical protein